MGGRGSCVGGVSGVHAEGLFISIPAVWIYSKIQMFMILNVHKKTTSFLTFFRKSLFPQSPLHSISARFPSSFHSGATQDLVQLLQGLQSSQIPVRPPTAATSPA